MFGLVPSGQVERLLGKTWPPGTRGFFLALLYEPQKRSVPSVQGKRSWIISLKSNVTARQCVGSPGLWRFLGCLLSGVVKAPAQWRGCDQAPETQTRRLRPTRVSDLPPGVPGAA